MAKTRKKPIKRTLSKPKATENDLYRLSRKYNMVDPSTSVEELRRRRQEVHEEMSRYSNQSVIYLWLLHPEEYGVYPGSIETFTPYEPEVIYPGYHPTYSSGDDGLLEGSVSGYDINDLIIPEGTNPTSNLDLTEIKDLANEDNLYVPDFKQSYLYYYYPRIPEIGGPLEESIDEDIYIEPEDNIISNDEMVELEFSDDSSKADENIKQEDIKQEDIKQENDYSLNNDYFSTRLNDKIYSPNINGELALEPDLSDDEYERVYTNRIPPELGKRRAVQLPEEKFINLSDLDKVKYDMTTYPKVWDGKITPEANAILDYGYELLYPVHKKMGPLTEEEFTMHPLMYPLFIPKLNFLYDPLIRQYINLNK